MSIFGKVCNACFKREKHDVTKRSISKSQQLKLAATKNPCMQIRGANIIICLLEADNLIDHVKN